jgi:exopolysaccharide biosynthesis polyprenyl glycosylphosphotransferase
VGRLGLQADLRHGAARPPHTNGREAVDEIVSDAFAGRRMGRRRLVRRALVGADVVGVALAYVVVLQVHGPARGAHASAELAALLLSLPVWVGIAALYGLYDQDDERTLHPTTDDLAGVFHVASLGTVLLFGSLALLGLADPRARDLVSAWTLTFVLVAISRLAARVWCRRRQAFLQRVVIVGAGDVGQRLARKILQHPEYGLVFVGFVDDAPKPRLAGLEDQKVLGAPHELLEIVRSQDVARVVIAFSGERAESVLAAARSLAQLDVQIQIVPRLFDLMSPNVRVDALERFPILSLRAPRDGRVGDALKRVLDFAGAAAGLLLTAPLFAYIAFRVHRDSPGPILFRQARLGRGEREFTALKFRTMRTDVDTKSTHRDYIAKSMDDSHAPTANGLYKLDQADAVTPFGRFLRRTSLDELPQLINVLRGEMSLVGPRPCIAYETAYFLPHHFERFRVRPGLTGLWQVTARAHSTFAEALDMDVAYARGRSLALDLRLICRTPFQVLSRKGTA